MEPTPDLPPHNAREHPESSPQAQHIGVISWIRDRIADGEFAPGMRIPERLVCERLGISRTPLREAFKVLAAERLLTLYRNRGAVVTPVSAKDADDAMQLIATLEGMAGELLCKQITAAEITALQTLQQTMEQQFEARDLLGYFKTNQAIHSRIMQAANNGILLETHQALCNRFVRYRFAGNRSEERWHKAVLEHQHILMAIEDRDAARLRYLMQAHVLNGWRIARVHVGFGDHVGCGDNIHNLTTLDSAL